MQTFDLHDARSGLHDCPCPNHGTEDCDCQMVVLLVYRQNADASTALNTSPATLILHGNDGQTWLSIADTPSQKTSAATLTAIRNALVGKLPARISDPA
ncbi:MAG: hypothetical protein HYU84_10975 [Chloroflexi bacterium]|nr:hypothetical protein [Chloroflexota bacterium]